MIKKIITVLLIISIFCSAVFAGNFTVKLEKIYSSGDKMMVSWEDGKKSALLVTVKEEGKKNINLINHFKVGGKYAAAYTDNMYIDMIVYDDNGNTIKFTDDTNSRLLEDAKAKSAKAGEEAQLKADQELPFTILGIVLAVLGGILLFMAIDSSVSSTSTSTSK